MLSETPRAIGVLVFSAALLLTALPAAADHSDPRTPLAPTDGTVAEGTVRGEGTWEHLANFPGMASEALTGGGTDFEMWRSPLNGNLYGAFGTLGQDELGSVGQRILLLERKGKVTPRWVADHGSAHCATENPSGTLGLQHDSQIARRGKVRLLTDTTDATGRCHDPLGGGLEIVDVTKITKKKFKPREIHLVRLAGFSHTHTVDAQRPWIVYNSSSDFAGRPWIDVVDLKSCFGALKHKLAKRRNNCRPDVFRIPFQPEWSQQRDWSTGELEPGSESACHDITFSGGRLYCAAPNATLIFDVSGIANAKGKVLGTPFPCEVLDGTNTGAKVTDCNGMGVDRTETALGWEYLGGFNHPGRDCTPPPTNNTNCNSNNFVRSDDGVAVAHEADPTADHKYVFVTDERGGGVVPPGSSCTPGLDNPFGNGGIHAFDISNPAAMDYAMTPEGAKAVFISDAVVDAPTFCDTHVIEHVPGEQRLIVAYYTQGIKIVDYFITPAGAFVWRETSSFTLPNANTWVAEDFKIVENADGTRTYYLAADDIHRGIDIISFRHTTNPIGSQPPPGEGGSAARADVGLLALGALLLPAAAWYGRRRRVPTA